MPYSTRPHTTRTSEVTEYSNNINKEYILSSCNKENQGKGEKQKSALASSSSTPDHEKLSKRMGH